MIINGGSRRKWRRFATHLGNEKDNERVRLVDVHGMKASTIKEGFTKLQAMADMAGAGEKEFYYHANINPKEGETLTDEQWDEAGGRLRQNLGLDGQPGMAIEHVKDGRTHRHFITLRVDLDTGKLIPDSHDYIKHQKTARELEREFDLQKVKGVHVEREGPRPERRPKTWEVQRGHRSGIDPGDVKAEVTELWEKTDSGPAFRTALTQRGYVLARGDRRDFLVIDPAGHEHSLARRVSGAKAADIRERLADIDHDELPRVGEGRTERKQDKGRVSDAVGRGADKGNIERAMNAGRAADIMNGPQDGGGGESQRQRIADEQALTRRGKPKETPEPSPDDWRGRLKREKEPEMER